MWCIICVILRQSVNSHSLLFIIFFRALITMTVSSVWHGVYVGYYLCLMSAPMYLPVEDVYVKIRKGTTGLVCVTFPYLSHKLDKSKWRSRNELDVHSLVSPLVCKETRESFLLITSEHCNLYMFSVSLSLSLSLSLTHSLTHSLI